MALIKLLSQAACESTLCSLKLYASVTTFESSRLWIFSHSPWAQLWVFYIQVEAMFENGIARQKHVRNWHLCYRLHTVAAALWLRSKAHSFVPQGKAALPTSRPQLDLQHHPPHHTTISETCRSAFLSAHQIKTLTDSCPLLMCSESNCHILPQSSGSWLSCLVLIYTKLWELFNPSLIQ